MIKLAILGSTGSIGRQTLDVVRAHRDMFSVEVLTAANNWELLAAQAVEFNVDAVVIGDECHHDALKDVLKDSCVKVWAGSSALEQMATMDSVDVVVVAVVGFAGLAPTLAAIKAGKRIALANKESLVVGGEIIMRMAREYNAPILPVDSEHSAIFQCLVGEQNPLKRILLTSSGGSLRDEPIEKLSEVTPERVLCHPVWDMGARITVDSALMLNKGFEVIEAAHLFGASADQIQVVIHPESIIHSAVEFADGAIKAQMSYPDMRLPIQYALTFPHRLPVSGLREFDPFTTSRLTFEKPDPRRYPCLELAYQCLKAAGVMPCALNAAGEVAVNAFLHRKIKFTDIYRIIEKTLDATPSETLTSIEQLYQCDAAARQYSQKLC